MHKDVKRITGWSLAAGLLAIGMTGAPAAAEPTLAPPAFEPRPLVEQVPDLVSPEGFVFSADDSTMYVLTTWGEGAIVDVATRQVTGTYPVIPELGYSESPVIQATGPEFAVPSQNGYIVLTLATGAYEEVELDPRPGETYPPSLTHAVMGGDGRVRAITSGGEYLVFDGATVVEEKRLRDPDQWSWQPSGSTADGSRYFETSYTDAPPYEATTSVYDMETGDTLGSITTPDGAVFAPLGFDASETSLWGTVEDEPGILVNLDIATGAELSRTSMGWFDGRGPVVADAAKNWIAVAGYPTLGGSIDPGTERGARDMMCCTTSMMRLPNNGDLVFYDVEMRQVGFVTAPRITDPSDAPITELGGTVEFRSDAEGLALTPDEQGADPQALHGSIWQQSADGVTWEDIENETGETLTVAATAENYPLQFRRHFLDPFWGPAPSSAPARMIGQGPEITRPDDLPAGTQGKAYPSQIITATGQPDMTWSSTDLPATLTLNPATGEITGTTDAAGTYEFTVTVTDVFGSDARLFHLTVADDAIVPDPDPDPDPDPKPTPGPDPKPTSDPKPTPDPGQPSGSTGSTLANTGSSLWLPMGAAGLLFLAAGVTATVIARKRLATDA